MELVAVLAVMFAPIALQLVLFWRDEQQRRRQRAFYGVDE